MGEGVNYFVALKNTWVLAEGREGEMVDNYMSINLHVQSFGSLK